MAEQRGDHVASFRLLSAEARAVYKSPADWARRRSGLPAITGFEVAGSSGDTVTFEVRHTPGIDPFVGLSAARERETWHTRREGAGWLVDGDPHTVLELPPDSGVGPAALAWAQAVQRCDKPASLRLQAVPVVLGVSQGANDLCHGSGTVAVGAVERAPSGPASADLVAQYSVAALNWARAVPLTGGPEPFHAVLAPIGDSWLVVAVYD